MTSLWSKTNYRSDIEFLIDTQIREFDITKANISVLRDANIISEELYVNLLAAPKMEREVYIGNLQKDNDTVSAALKAGITEARKIFMESNGIEDHEILAIRNDAIVVIGNRPIYNLSTSERVAFRESAKYTSFYHVNRLDFYYYFNRIDNIEVLDIKGLGKDSIPLHKDFMLDFLCALFCCAQIEPIAEAIALLENFHRNYIEFNLPAGYYRELNSQSRYKLSPVLSRIWDYQLDDISEAEKSNGGLDPTFNEAILRKFNSMLASVYFATR